MTTDGTRSSAAVILAASRDPTIGAVTGELQPIGTRPQLVATFDPPGADEAFRAWREGHAEALATVPPEALRVEYGRAAGGGLFVRVRIDEAHVPAALPS
jgi:hypothetical protein